MLVIDRYTGQKIIVKSPSGEKMTIEILGTTNYGAVRVGFSAPRFFNINREEKENQLNRSMGGSEIQKDKEDE